MLKSNCSLPLSHTLSLQFSFTENYPVLNLFITVGAWTLVRYWFDPCAMLEYHGNFEVIGKSELYKQWKIQSRMSTIMTNVTRSHGTKIWMTTFLFIIFALVTLAVGALGYERGISITLSQSSKEVAEDGYSVYTTPLRLTPRGDFYYPPQKNLQYPTCSIFGGIDVAGGVETALIDTTFLSGQVIYQDPATFQDAIDLWFGPGVGRLDTNVTRAYRDTLLDPNMQVNYDIFSFREDKLAVVVVRGSWTAWVSNIVVVNEHR